MKFVTFLFVASVAPTSAIRKSKRSQAVEVQAVDDDATAVVDVETSTNCRSLANLIGEGKPIGKTLELICSNWPPSMGQFPVGDIGRAKELFDKAMGPGGAWEQIQKIRRERTDRGFCWRNNTLRDPSTDKCPLGYMRSGLSGIFTRSCRTGCMWSSHPMSCGMGCASNRSSCGTAVMDQAFVVAQGIGNVYGFVTGDQRITDTVTAVVNLAEFLLQAVPPLVQVVKGAVGIIENNEVAVVIATLLFQYAQEHAGDVGESLNSIREAIRHFADVIAAIASEQASSGRISPGTVIRAVLDHGEGMLDFAVRATKVFAHPTCAVTANVAFTIETVGDDRLQGPWVPRGTINGRPRYTLVGDRSTNLEWSNSDGGKWVMFSDNWSGSIARRFLYESSARSNDYPEGGWSRVREGLSPVPEIVSVM